MANPTVFTIGHSDHDAVSFVDLLKRHNIRALIDVRSHPGSTWAPQFNRAPLRNQLKTNGIRYAFMGEELGVRSKDPSHYEDGRVAYGKLSASSVFRDGIRRISQASRTHELAIMCSEQDPLTCHRSILLAPALERSGVGVAHILRSGDLISQTELIERLLREEKLAQPDLFRPHERRIEEALTRRGEAIAWRDPAAPGSRASA